MTNPQTDWTDQEVEELVGRLLQLGVTLAALVVLLGGLIYLARHATETVDYHTFPGSHVELRTLGEIGVSAAQLHGQGIIQLGLLLLIATPVARVALTVFAFLKQRDTVYVVVTLVVLAILVCSLVSGYFGF
jgi:uncharacterized membrane protein